MISQLIKALCMSHINQNASYQQKLLSHTSAINHKAVPFYYQFNSFCSSLGAMTTMKILWLLFPVCFSDSITNHKDMVDCFFLHYEVSNNDGTDSIVLHFYANIGKNNIIIFFLLIWTLKLHMSKTASRILVINVVTQKSTPVWKMKYVSTANELT